MNRPANDVLSVLSCHVENIVLLERSVPKKEDTHQNKHIQSSDHKQAQPKPKSVHRSRPSRRSQFADRNRAVFGKSGKKSEKK